MFQQLDYEVYEAIVNRPWPSQTKINTLPSELREYYAKVEHHLKNVDVTLAPPSEAVVRLHAEQ